ncbi:unnamed protein product [Urochloa humidicola]
MPTTLPSLEASVDATLSTIGEQGQRCRPAQPFTIFRVPAYVRDANRTAYEPRMVSIGPYYHGAAALRAMEDHKWRYLHDLLSRNRAVSSSILIEEMGILEPRARACYSERPLLGSDDFVRMLLLDGCFILEFFFKWHTREPDELCDVGWGLTLVRSDLLLLENQLPFFVVEKLYDVVAGVHGGRELLVNLFLEYASDDKPIARPPSDSEIHHLLHLYYESFVPKLPATATATTGQEAAAAEKMAAARVKMIPRATEMSAAGPGGAWGRVRRGVRQAHRRDGDTPHGGGRDEAAAAGEPDGAGAEPAGRRRRRRARADQLRVAHGDAGAHGSGRGAPTPVRGAGQPARRRPGGGVVLRPPRGRRCHGLQQARLRRAL